MASKTAVNRQRIRTMTHLKHDGDKRRLITLRRLNRMILLKKAEIVQKLKRYADDRIFDIVYLDFDGVFRINGEVKKECADNIIRLFQWHQNNTTGRTLKIVVLSSWKDIDTNRMNDILKEAGLGLYTDGIVDYVEGGRELQILNHRLKAHYRIGAYVIIDDANDFREDSVLSGNLVKTDPGCGYTDNDLKKTIAILDRQLH